MEQAKGSGKDSWDSKNQRRRYDEWKLNPHWKQQKEHPDSWPNRRIGDESPRGDGKPKREGARMVTVRNGIIQDWRCPIGGQ